MIIIHESTTNYKTMSTGFVVNVYTENLCGICKN